MADTRRLPLPIADAWEWQLQGACRSADVALFFNPDGERGRAQSDRDAAAIAVCRRCPVLESCRRHALTAREPDGVWGGMTAKQRFQLLEREDLRRIRVTRSRAASVHKGFAPSSPGKALTT